MKHVADEVRRAFEHGRLRFESVRSFDDWWSALCAAAEDLKLSRVALWFAPTCALAGQGPREWRANHVPATDRVRTTLLLRATPAGPPGTMQLEAPVDGSLESASCRIHFISRLIDENPPTHLGDGGVSGEQSGPDAACSPWSWEATESGQDASLAELGAGGGPW
jgi:hypothetical protein